MWPAPARTPAGAEVEFSLEHDPWEGCADMGGRTACGRTHCVWRWSSLWGHGQCEGCAGMGGGGTWTLPPGLWVEALIGPREGCAE